MIQNLISMNGYGIFVWASFSITFTTCFIFYYKTLKTLKKHEKDFAEELSKLSLTQRTIVLKRSKIASKVLASYNKSI
tara:strand:- start:1517 stop:1750 length:234 start_codon:yes stop_codon:yes gene_type:complete